MHRYLIISAIVFVFVIASCNSGSQEIKADTAEVPVASDTMPVIIPRISDSSGVIKTPSTGDDNVVMPDSAIKTQ